MLCFITATTAGKTQTNPLPFRYARCDTKAADTGYYMKDAAGFLARTLAARGIDPGTEDFSAPYNVRVFIRIVRQDNGTLAGCT
ncbi:MAG: hypothetical protein EOO88_50815, partial [Pedobacter sp.]